MQSLKTIENLLGELNSEDFKSVNFLIKKQINNNRQLFEKSIMAGDIDKIDFYIDKVSFDEDYLKNIKSNTVPHLSSLQHIAKKQINDKFAINDADVLNTFYILFHDVLNLGVKKDFAYRVKKENTTFNASDILFASLFYRLTTNFQYSGDEPYSKYLFLKKTLEKDSTNWTAIMNTFVKYTLPKLDYQDNSLLIQELIKMGYKDSLCEQAKNEKNYTYLQTIFPIKAGYNNEFMLKGLSIFNFSMVKQSFKHGIPFFLSDDSLSATEKAAYKNTFSRVFASKDSFTIQEYIIDNIPDISVGNHIIVKTILNKLESSYETDSERNNERIALVHKIFNRYVELDNEKIQQLKHIIEKREDSYSKELLNKLIDFNLFSQKYPPLDNKAIKNKI